MIPELRPFLKILRWVRFIDRIYRTVEPGILGRTREFLSRDHVEAARSLAVPNYKRSYYKAYDYEGVHPDIKMFWKSMETHMAKRNTPVWAFEFVRTKKRQHKLFMEGRSKAKAGKSPHQYGMAVDIVHGTRAWNLTKKEWDVIGQIGKEIARKRKLDMEWGGDWNFYDPAHWQLKNWRDLLD